MSEVNLLVGGKHYAVTCAPGEEARIAQLGSMIDEKIAGLNGSRSTYDAQNLLFAALFLADELVDAREPSGSADKSSAKAAAALEKLADRLENLASTLEQATEAA